MKRRWKILAGFAVLTLVGIWVLLHTSNPELRDLEATQRSLRQQGFKLDLREFNFSLSPEESRRAAALARTTRAELTNQLRPNLIMGNIHIIPPSLTPISSNAVVTPWKLDHLKGYDGRALWAALREVSETNQAQLEAARQAAMSGPIRFQPIGSPGPNPLLPYLADMRILAFTFEALTLLALHDGDHDAAWSNLLAVTCLATAYNPEPISISQLSRFSYLAIAFDATWSALQAPGWTEAQLTELQRRWQGLHFWSNLPDTAAYSRAEMAAMWELERQRSLGLGLSMQEVLRHPGNAWAALTNHWSLLSYRQAGSYEDEKALLLYYRDRELELRQAVRAPTWAEMRQLPGATNIAPFPLSSGPRSRMLAMMNLRRMNMAFQGRGVGLLGQAAEAETRRRLVLTALALARYHSRHGGYPRKLAELIPELLDALPADFMDGQPLRYQLTQDGHFVLYSVGLDGVDNGGTMRQPTMRSMPGGGFFGAHGAPQETDLVWPCPASDAEAQRFQDEQKREQDTRLNESEAAQAAAWWDITSRHQANVERILAAPSARITHEPVYGGHRLSEILSNRPGTNPPTLLELLTLKPVPSGAEPETAAFELPIKYEALTNLGELVLCIDRYGPDDEEGGEVGHNYECIGATNGDCRLLWNTIYETPGKHALVAGLGLKNAEDDEGLFGPVTAQVVSNLCQFNPESALLDPERGAKFYARLPEPKGAYQVELKSPSGETLKTITGSTTNGFIELRWDLTDEHGRHCTNNAYDSIFHITLPASGRSQTLRGP